MDIVIIFMLISFIVGLIAGIILTAYRHSFNWWSIRHLPGVRIKRSPVPWLHSTFQLDPSKLQGCISTVE
jgi:hypothetical protein